jgi:hypothetical protein
MELRVRFAGLCLFDFEPEKSEHVRVLLPKTAPPPPHKTFPGSPPAMHEHDAAAPHGAFLVTNPNMDARDNPRTSTSELLELNQTEVVFAAAVTEKINTTSTAGLLRLGSFASSIRVCHDLTDRFEASMILRGGTFEQTEVTDRVMFRIPPTLGRRVERRRVAFDFRWSLRADKVAIKLARLLMRSSSRTTRIWRSVTCVTLVTGIGRRGIDTIATETFALMGILCGTTDCWNQRHTRASMNV